MSSQLASSPILESPEVSVPDATASRSSEKAVLDDKHPAWNDVVAGTEAHDRYGKTWDVSHLDTAVDAFQRAVNVAPEPDAILLGNLGRCLLYRHEPSGSLDDLERALAALQHALELVPEEHPDRALRLDSMAYALQLHFERLGELDDLEHAIVMRHRADELTPDRHPNKPIWLNNLGLSLRNRFERLGELDDLEQAIAAQRRALELAPEQHPDKPIWLSNLGLSLQGRFERLGELDDLERAIAAQRRALELAPEQHPDKPIWLNNLGASLQRRFERLGELDDIEQAIAAQRRAVELTLDGHPDKPMWLSNLGLSLQTRFKRLGELDDLEQAIGVQRCAVELTPDEHPSKPIWLNNLGSSLQSRFERLGELDDLEQAIAAKRRAVELAPEQHPSKPIWLNNLGTCLQSRFERLGELDDLEQGITVQQHAVELTPDGHPDKSIWLNNLGLSLQRRFECLGELDDLEQAIVAQQRAVELTPDGHPSKPIWLNNLGLSLQRRFECLGELDDLEQAIAAKRRAVELTPEGHPNKPTLLSNLGQSFQSRFERLGELGDIERAIVAQRSAVELTPDGDPYKANFLVCLGVSLLAQLRHEKTKVKFEETLSCFMIASADLVGSSSERLNAAGWAVGVLSEYPQFSTPGRLLSAHSLVVDILPEIVWLGHSLKRRFQESSTARSLVASAVHAAIGVGALSQAAEWLEAGRSFVWSQILSFRIPLDVLENELPVLARRLRTVHAQLQSSTQTSSYSNSVISAADQDLPSISDRAESDHNRGLAIEYGHILADVRREPGFEDYLRPKKLSALVSSYGAATAVSLPKLSSKRARELRSQWLLYIEQHNARERGMVKTPPRTHRQSNDISAVHILGRIWGWIVHPVLQALGLIERQSKGSRLPHITWCPTGSLTQVPLHAAGMYNQDSGPRVYDFVVSSYTPSLSALTRGVEAIAKQRPHPSVLVVTQPNTPRLSPLPGTVIEGECLQEVFAESRISCSALNGEQATPTTVRAVLDDHTWLHLACHGSQDLADPLQSAFALHDGRISLADLMTTTSENAELAFLSACQTAVGDEKIPEESMHLAAGMLAVGYKGVIATMWSIRDDDAPLVVETYYRKLLELRASGTLGRGETGAAYALHDATKRLREKVDVKDFVRWAPFVHFGI